MNLPSSQTLDTRKLGNVFDNTVATYKYYWFVAILDLIVVERRQKFTFWEIIAGMISEAWYPVHYFKLSFGKSDSLYQQIITLQQEFNFPIDASKADIKQFLNNNLDNPRIRTLLRVFTQNVPYRFLSPWITHTVNVYVVQESRCYKNNCPYSITGDTIEINPTWVDYLTENYVVLRDFSFWNLTIFLQKRNPNVPNLPSKLVKPIQRDALSRQRRFWDTYIDKVGSISCIYTGQELHRKEFALDHFVPWSFVSHNLLWNLLPADASINSSKSNNLPPLEIYLRPFARLHQQAITEIYPANTGNTLLEDYLTMYHSVPELIRLTEADFYQVFLHTFTPMVQIAENMGFRYWQKPLVL